MAASLAPTPAQAQLLAYEGFDYTPGNLTTLMNGGSGWSQAWQPNATVPSNQQILSGGFAYTDGLGNILNVSGHRVHITADGSATGDNIGGVNSSTSANPIRGFSFSRGATGNPQSTWISMVALRTGMPLGSPGQPAIGADGHLYGRSVSAQFWYNAASSTTGGTEMFDFGRSTQSVETNSLPNDTWSVLQNGNVGTTKASSVNFANPPADFLLIRIDHVGTTVTDVANADTLRLWINPNLDIAPSDGSADVTFTANEFGLAQDLVFNRFRIFAGGVNATTGYGSVELDELRVGVAFADVTPYTVPEPAITVLGGLSLLVFLLRRRG